MKKQLTSIFLCIFVIFNLGAMPDFFFQLNGTAALKYPVSVMTPVSSRSFNALKGVVGEYSTQMDYLDRLTRTGWTSVTPRTGSQGLDHFFMKFNSSGYVEDVLIVETKMGTRSVKQSLGMTSDDKQMSQTWVQRRIERSILAKYDEIIQLDGLNEIEVVHQVPKENLISSKFAIDKEAFYFTKNGDDRIYFYDRAQEYTDPDVRIGQTRSTKNTIQDFSDHNLYKRRVVKYVPDSAQGLIQETYVVVTKNGVDDYELLDSNRFPSQMLEKIVDSSSYQAAVISTYALADSSFYSDLTTTEKIRLMNSDIDKTIARKMFKPKANIEALNRKLGLNPNTPITSLDFSDSEWRKISTVEFSDLDDGTRIKLRNASRQMTARQVTIGGLEGAALGFSISILGQMILNKSLSDINWQEVGVSAGIVGFSMAASKLSDMSGSLIKGKLISSSNKFARVMSKNAPITLGFGVDLLVDSGFAFYNYYNGTYSLNQTLADIGFNAAMNVPIYFLSTLVSNLTAGVIGGSWGGPISMAAGLAVGVMVSFGSTFVFNPIKNEIEIRDIFADLSKPNKDDTVQSWTITYLKELGAVTASL
ncbi:hypothetical protein [Sphaerochaeta sp. UBA5849]|jgi:hypothetical protein|uniref:hypothetical protein n=1 Tax=Sphaerochaeta sp. UBA5849 TaxID=1947475 RepID=UPI0031F55193